MGRWGKLFAIAALAACLPTVRAQQFSVRIPASAPPAAIEFDTGVFVAQTLVSAASTLVSMQGRI